MDIYQTWTTYNKQWSKYEIIAFCGLLLLAIIIVGFAEYRKMINIIQVLAILALVIFLSIVFDSTVFTRTSTVRQYELIPFWFWAAIWEYHNWELLKENLLNCILLLPVIVGHKVKWYWALLFGVLISSTIEVSQLIFKRGLFEW